MVRNNILFSAFTFFLKFLNNFLLFSILSHYFSVEVFGFVGYSITLGLIFTHIVDYGYRLKVVKDISSNSVFDINIYLSKIIITKVIVSFFVFLAIGYFWFFSKQTVDRNIFITLILLSSILMSFFNLNTGIFQGKNLFHLETKLYTLYTILIFLSLFISIYLHTILPIAVGFFIGALIIFVLSYMKVQKLIKFLFYKKLNWIESFINELKEAFPYAIHVVISTLLINMEIIFIEHFFNEYELGIYQAYIKVITGLTIISTVFSSALLPVVSKQIKQTNYDLVKKNIFIYTNMLLLIMSFILVVYFLFDEFLIFHLFGKEYIQIEKYKLFIILIVIFKYLSIIPGIILTVSENQILRVKILAIVLIITIVSFIFFLPKYGFQAAFYISTVSNFVISASYFLISKNILNKLKTTKGHNE